MQRNLKPSGTASRTAGFLAQCESLKWYPEGRTCRHGQARIFNRSFLCANKRGCVRHGHASERRWAGKENGPLPPFLRFQRPNNDTPFPRCHDNMTDHLTTVSVSFPGEYIRIKSIPIKVTRHWHARCLFQDAFIPAHTRKQMTKTTRLSCVMATVLPLTFGIAMAADHSADHTEARHAEPTAVNAPENQSTLREESAQNPSQSTTPATQEVQVVPAKPQQEPDCN